MKQLAPDEKTATVMVYTNNMLVRGDVILKETARASILLRTQGAQNFIHMFGVQAVVFGGAPPKTHAYEEIFVHSEQVIAFHLVPPAVDPVDYDETEANRVMQNIQLLMGTFSLKGKMRVSISADFSASLEVMRVSWASVYDAEITNPYLPQFSVNVPMLLISPSKVAISPT